MLSKEDKEANDILCRIFDKAFKPVKEILKLYEVLDNKDKGQHGIRRRILHSDPHSPRR